MTSNSQEIMFHVKRLKKITTTKNKPKIVQNQKLIRDFLGRRLEGGKLPQFDCLFISV